MKDTINYTYYEGDMAWSFPKISPDYLIAIYNELISGQYDLTLLVPLIYDMRTYPIKCTDLTVKPMTYEEHDANKKEYDMSDYIFERHDGVDKD